MGEATFTFRVEQSLKDEFTAAARNRDRSGAQLLRDFMRDFIKHAQAVEEHDAWFRREVQIGIDAANAGELASSEEVEREAAVWRAETRRKLTGAKS